MTPGDAGQRRARRRDRQVYLRSHPFLFLLLAATRRQPSIRLGGTVIAHSREAFTDGLTRVRLDRTAHGTTGAAAGRLAGDGLLFDQDGDGHRGARREVADALGADGVLRLRPVWLEVLERRLAPLAAGRPVDLVDVVAELSGATAATLLKLGADPLALATAAREAAAAGAREHVPGLRSSRHRKAAREAAATLNALVNPTCRHADPTLGGVGQAGHEAEPGCPAAAGHEAAAAHQAAAGHEAKRDRRTTCDRDAEPGGDGLAAMLAVAAINTTVAGLPRAAAWCADADLWGYAETAPEALTAELLRVTAPTPLLPRVAAAAGTIAGRTIRAGDRLILIARHAVGADRDDPAPDDPAPQRVAQLVFGVGPHACPGARLARMQFTDTLAALAPHRPTVLSARADRRSALPSWSSLVLIPGRGR